MPENIILDIDKDNFDEIIKKNNSKNDQPNNLTLKLTIPVEIVFSSLEELEILSKFIVEDKKLEYLKINLPGSFNFEELFSDELIKEQPPNLKITIQEKIDSVSTTTSFNEFL